MGIFGKPVEIRKDFFEPCLNLNKSQVSSYRERQGFKVEIENSYKKIIVNGRIGGLLKYIEVSNLFWNNGELAWSITLWEFSFQEVRDFMNANFIKSTDNNSSNIWILPGGEKIHLESKPEISFSIGKATYYDY